jgi:sarcosine oxidase subunit alpha
MMESKPTVQVLVDGESVPAPAGSTLAAVLMQRGCTFRRSVTGEPRQPLCAMGTCFECRVTVDGRPHVRACRIVCRDGMEVETGR